MSGMNALLVYGYVLSVQHTWKWDLAEPAWDEDHYEMQWPRWVLNADEPYTAFEKRLTERGAHLQGKITLDMCGNCEWQDMSVLLFATESKHVAVDGAAVIEEFTFHSTGWNTALRKALDILEIVPLQQGPKWILAADVY